MKRGYLSLAIVGVAACIAVWAFTSGSQVNNGMNLSSSDIAFQKYMTKHGKSYATKEEYLFRKELFEQYLI
jgi:KDEL-tailed cysteine endopeptidase